MCVCEPHVKLYGQFINSRFCLLVECIHDGFKCFGNERAASVSHEFTLVGVRDLHGVGVAVDKVPGQPSHPGRPRAARGSRPPPLLSAVHPGAVGGVASTPPEGVASHPALTIAAITGAPGGRCVNHDRAPDGDES